MAKIITNIPDPKTEYSVENQRLINLALNQMVQKLNTGQSKGRSPRRRPRQSD